MNKFLYLLLIAFMSFAVTSCGNDDDDPPTDNVKEQLLVGEWSEASGRYSYHLVFTANGTGYDKVFFSNGQYNVDETFVWSISGDDLTIVWSEGTVDMYIERFYIVDLTATSLILRDKEDSDLITYKRV
ncbi:MAG: lipocalin family protein [Muribaculaceae bacterium]